MEDPEVVRRSSSKVGDKENPENATDAPAEGAQVANANEEVADDDMILWEPYGKLSKEDFNKKAWKNLFVVSIANMLVYISFLGLIELQSSLHVQEGMGVINLSIRYATLFLSCLTAPDLLIRILSHKYVIVLSYVSFLIWDLANGYAVWATMIPASILNGFFVGPLYVARYSYVTGIGRWLAEVNSSSKSSIVSMFYGVAVSFHILAGTIGSLISFFVLDIDPGEVEYKPSKKEVADNCGMNDCPWNVQNGTFTTDVPRDTVWTLVFVYLVCCIAGIVLVWSVLDHFPRNRLDTSKTWKEDFTSLLFAAFRQMKNPKQMMLIPYSMYLGIASSFWVANFTKSWVTCGIGVQYNGLVSLPVSFFSAFLTAATGKAAAYTHRVPLLLIGTIGDIVSYSIIAFWPVNPEQKFMFFLITLIAAIPASVWDVCVGSMHGFLFPESTSAAYSNHLLWNSLAFAIGLAYDSTICTDNKLYILVPILTIGSLSIYALEYIVHKESEARKAAEAKE